MRKFAAVAAVLAVVSISACKKTGEGEYQVERPVVGTQTDLASRRGRIQSQEEVAQAAEAMEQKAVEISNVTYTHPNEDGSVSEEADALAAAVPKVGRNDPCPCGSGKKFKKCCLPRVSAP